ncbi:hypothetical protein [uncultured Draconibacterium sp.]|uniref:hypothetical protein n=1 Tax=uncultured Draconibacterium sp. TaxID=1573823 RepID=UPI0032166251
MTEPKITLIKLSEFGYEKENNLFLSSPKKGKLKMSSELINKNPHVSSTKTSKWKDFFTPRIDDEFNKLFGSTLEILGYSDKNGK